MAGPWFYTEEQVNSHLSMKSKFTITGSTSRGTPLFLYTRIARDSLADVHEFMDQKYPGATYDVAEGHAPAPDGVAARSLNLLAWAVEPFSPSKPKA